MGKLNQKGFSTVESLLILVIVAILGATGWYVYNANKKTNATYNSASQIANSSNPKYGKLKSAASNQSQASTQQTTKDFVNSVLVALSANDQTKLDSSLTPAFKAYRAKNLATYPCAGKTIQSPLVLICGSQLDPEAISKLTPTVTNFTFKDGTKGKSVDYKIVKTSGDTGVTYFTFKLVATKNTWQLNDYGDVFVGTGSTAPSPLLGKMEGS